MVRDYIDRADVCLQLEKQESIDGQPRAIRRARRIVAEFPAADVVEVRHGRWINGRCSECGEHAPFWSMATTYHLSKYCHGCGAKMDGGQDDV